MNRRHWISGIFTGALLLLVAFVLSMVGGDASNDDQKRVVVDQQQAQADLFVDPSMVAEDFCASLVRKYPDPYLTQHKLGQAVPVADQKGVSTVVFDAGVTHDWGSGKTEKITSNAVNTRLSPQTMEAERATVCRDPAQAAMVMNRLGAIRIGDTTVAQVNSDWIQAQGNPRVAIQRWAQSCMTTVMPTHTQCAHVMAYAATLLGKFASAGVHTMPTTAWNVYLPNGAVVGKIPAYGMNPVQEKNGHFLVFEYTSKTGSFCLKYGFNVGTSKYPGGDQRLAGFTCQAPHPAKPKKATPSKPSTSRSPLRPPVHRTTPSAPPRTTPRTPPTKTPCSVCVDKTAASQKPLPAPSNTRPVPSNPPKPTTTASAPIVSGSPTPVDTGTHTAPIPTPTGGPFG